MIKLAKVIINNIESLKQNASAADTRMSDAFSKVGSDFMKVYDRFAEIEKQIKNLVINFSSGALNEPRVREIIRDILTETLEEVLPVSLDDYFPNKKGGAS